MKASRGFVWPAVVLVIVLGLIVYGGMRYVASQKSQESAQSQVQSATPHTSSTPSTTATTSLQQSVDNYIVVLKANPSDSTKSDVYLKDMKTGKEEFFITLQDVSRDDYHPAEYHNGSLYILVRPGGEDAYDKNPNWTDELWKYDQQKKGTKIYSSQGLDFRVSDDERFIAIIDRTGSDSSHEVSSVVFLKNDGTPIKTVPLTAQNMGVGDDFPPNDTPSITPLTWSNDTFWFSGGHTCDVDVLANIDATTFHMTTFNMASSGIGCAEFSLNPTKERIAFSDYPISMTEDLAQDAAVSKEKMTLYVYDLVTKNKQIVATSIGKAFNPEWIDGNTLGYDDPNGSGRTTKSFP